MPKRFRLGFTHIKQSQSRVAALIFVVIFGALGTYLLFGTHAATTYIQFQSAYDTGLCLDNYGNSTASKNPIVIWSCSGTDAAQKWVIESVSGGGFLLKDTAGTCADDTGDGVGKSSSDRVYLQTYGCNTSDHAQIWDWSGGSPGQIVNQYSDGCINDTANSKTDGTQLIIYGCSPVTSNAQWYEVAVQPPEPSVTLTAPASGATVSGSSVLVSANASISSGSITSITLSANGATLLKCDNATTCFTDWDTKSLSNGSYTVSASAEASGGGSSTTSEQVSVSNSSPSPTPTPNPNPSPSPSPSPKPKPSPSPKLGGGSSGSSPSSGASTTPSTSQGLGSTSQPSTNTPTTLNTTVTNNPEPSISTNGKPSISNIEATRITTDSITLTWQATDASNYTIKYGLSAKSLPVTRTLQTNDAVPIVTLNGLPAGKDIYIQITPSNNGVNGATNQVNFKTSSGSGSGAGALILSILIGIAVAFIFIMFRRRKRGQEVVSDIDVSNVPLYPREDSATEASRLNWWMPDSQRQQAGQPASQHKADDDAPDMYEEGRKRLEDEEKQHKLPGS